MRKINYLDGTAKNTVETKKKKLKRSWRKAKKEAEKKPRKRLEAVWSNREKKAKEEEQESSSLHKNKKARNQTRNQQIQVASFRDRNGRWQ